MSAGCVHQKASVALAGGFLLGSLAFGNGIEYAIGSVVGIMLTPDLDVDRTYIGNKIIRNRIGHWAEQGWNMFWYFYKKSLKHGGPLSHFPGISTVFRLAYIFLFLLVIPYTLFEIITPGAWNTWNELGWWIELGAKHYKVILGLMGSDLIHYALDVLTSENTKQKTRTQVFGVPLASSTCKGAWI
jgi:uncharacterized metal-binding protein